jgi:hypothetical protein
MLVLVGP